MAQVTAHRLVVRGAYSMDVAAAARNEFVELATGSKSCPLRGARMVQI
jgi:hypothetical protein